MKKYIIPLVALFFTLKVFTQSLEPVGLRCENIENPLGIDVKQPRLTWMFLTAEKDATQAGFEVILSDNQNNIDAGKGNIWKYASRKNNNNFVIVPPEKLKSFTKYYWRVRTYDSKKQMSKWSAVNTFETSFLNNEWDAKWIADNDLISKQSNPYQRGVMPVYVREISIPKPVRTARLYISGLGYYEAYLNNLKIGDHRLDPGWTDYSKTVLYVTYDITNLLQQGKNIMNVMTGYGWYNLYPLEMWCSKNFRSHLYSGVPCLKAQMRIEYADGTIEELYTDKNWKISKGPIISSDVYLEEVYDARKEFSITNKQTTNAVEIVGPAGMLKSQMSPPIKVINTLLPKSIKELGKDIYLIDMGQNFTGVLKIKVKGERGRKITIRYGEDIYSDGSLNGMTSVAGQIKAPGCGGEGAPDVAYQTDSYILKGEDVEVWSPRFTFRGFRYAEITGWPSKPTLDNFEGLVLSNDVSDAGSFTCSDTLINKLYENIRWTFRNNLFSVQSDCPAREKLGYGGDLLCTATSFMYNYDMHNLYKKILNDFTDAQRKEGGITETAPYVGIKDFSPADDESGPISFQAVYPFLIDELYTFYGDVRIIRDNYDNMKKLVEYLISTSKNDLHYIDISDHESLEEKPDKFSAACFYLFHLEKMKQFAHMLSNNADELRYKDFADKTRNAILETYFDSTTGEFDNNTQSAQVFGLWFPLLKDGTPEKQKALKSLLSTIEKKDYHIYAGIFGTKMMFDVLRDNDLNNVAYKIITQPDYPGWFHMIRNGATTLWETWKYSDNVYSQNHPMFGSIMAWFYNSLAGIRPTGAGFTDIIIKPDINNDLRFVKSFYNSPKGKIVSEWYKDGNELNVKIVVPTNTQAEIWLPKGKVLLNTRDGKAFSGMKIIKKTNDYSVFKVNHGDYSFTIQYQ